jgi:hypothetical protein
MKKKVYEQAFSTLDELILLVRKAWNEVSLEIIRKVILRTERLAKQVVIEEGEWINN